MSGHQHHAKHEPERKPEAESNGSQPPFEAIGKVSVWAVKHWAKGLMAVGVSLVIADNHLTRTPNNDAKPLMDVETNLVAINSSKGETLNEVVALRSDMESQFAQVNQAIAEMSGELKVLVGQQPSNQNHNGSPHEQTLTAPWQMPSVNPPSYPSLTGTGLDGTLTPQ